MDLKSVTILALVAAIAYRERRDLYLMVLSAYARLTNWKR